MSTKDRNCSPYPSIPPRQRCLTTSSSMIQNIDEYINEPQLCLNDEIINEYMNLITARSPDTVYAFNSFFYFAFSNNNYSKVRRWTKNIDIFSKKKLFIPIHIAERNHWCLVFVDFENRSIKYYDSLGGLNFVCLKTILRYLMCEHVDKKNENFYPGGWLLINMNKCPRQQNDWDCGVFACIIAEHLARDAPLDFSQNDMPNFRRQLVLEIKMQKLKNPI